MGDTPFGFGSREWLEDEPRPMSNSPEYETTDELDCPACDHSGPMHVYHVEAPGIWFAVCPVCDKTFEP